MSVRRLCPSARTLSGGQAASPRPSERRLVALTTTSFDIVRNLSALRLEARMSAVVQPAMWDRLLSLPMSFFRRFAAGDLAQRGRHRCHSPGRLGLR